MARERYLKNRKVLISGGAGFIGSNLCESFLEHGNEIICLDNLSTGSIDNIEPLLSYSNFKFIEGDIRDFATCEAAMQGVDVILHQAALGSIPRSMADPLTTNSVNIDGFLNVLHAAKEQGIKRMVYAASSSTYGDSKELPKVEDHIGKQLSPYAVTKYVNELYAQVYGSLYGMEIIGLRYFNVFGRKQSPDGAYAAAIPRFIQSFIEHRSPKVHGDGRQTRDFTYVKNVVQINHLAASTENTKALNEVYNVAYGQETMLLQLIEKIRTLLSCYDPVIAQIPLMYEAPRSGDVRASLADINKAQNYLSYRPEFNLDEGLEESISWYWQNLKSDKSVRK